MHKIKQYIDAVNERLYPVSEFLSRRSTAIAVAGMFGITGIYMMSCDKNIPQWYIGLLLFGGFKIIFNYRKCTISYIECKLRGVKKEQGILNSFLDGIINLRYLDYGTVIVAMFLTIVLSYYFLVKEQKLVF
ncbi:hypothetical protein TetV_559 [Tetraselmis virus 1]|uniref:Uncharacterized protein n=1 Tax=Tetraselmis virus 1 TaxID=2060617 RepID=A0A2P0VP26_9VIRU|nr:hypothetical protein QJ968_gp495 [Tetraselmis virus 1]AUF82641.1 hypothetical protein TetV_559 [Tetraselmis virus 1]